mmetsp:Transcript_55687/g.103037  ORF Transcript_55687/g.103037 Transcript_55687/m.103037 type:complete len:160 (+) Transcript_55687:2-481(+)
MKVAADGDMLTKEVQRLQKYAHLPVVPLHSDINTVSSGAYFLMTPGTPLTREYVSGQPSVLEKILDALGQLHSHGVVHGDARVVNAIMLKSGACVWVDFYETESSTDQGKAEDIMTLCGSLGISAADWNAPAKLEDTKFKQWVAENITSSDSAKRRRTR